jgi:hypothetical protein
MAAVIMACGAKVCFGIPSLMDGNLYPESSHHIETLGDWYKPRRSIFINSIPMKYNGNKVPGIKIPDKEYGPIGCIKDKDYILHFVKFKKTNIPLSICFSHKYWKNIKKIYVEPQSIELPFKPGQDTTELLIPQNYVDSVDTILRISM